LAHLLLVVSLYLLITNSMVQGVDGNDNKNKPHKVFFVQGEDAEAFHNLTHEQFFDCFEACFVKCFPNSGVHSVSKPTFCPARCDCSWFNPDVVDSRKWWLQSNSSQSKRPTSLLHKHDDTKPMNILLTDIYIQDWTIPVSFHCD